VEQALYLLAMYIQGGQKNSKFSTECAGEKNENRLIFGEDMDKSLRLTFLGHPVRMRS